LPNVLQQLSTLYQTIDARVVNHARLLRLSGRLDLLLNQIDIRTGDKTYLQPEDDTPESIYMEGRETEEVSEEEDDDMLELIEGADSDDAVSYMLIG
jgi:U3 small nucleolar RNA-associated protein 5